MWLKKEDIENHDKKLPKVSKAENQTTGDKFPDYTVKLSLAPNTIKAVRVMYILLCSAIYPPF